MSESIALTRAETPGAALAETEKSCDTGECARKDVVVWLHVQGCTRILRSFENTLAVARGSQLKTYMLVHASE
jgi:hypothetical protein